MRSESSRRAGRAHTNEPSTKEVIVKYLGDLGDGTFIVEHADGRLERQRDETNWERVKSITDEELEKIIADDPDEAPFRDIDWSTVKLEKNTVKTPVSIRLDPDVLAFFKKDGPGYQKRINKVLRAFVEQKSKKRA